MTNREYYERRLGMALDDSDFVYYNINPDMEYEGKIKDVYQNFKKLMNKLLKREEIKK